MPLPIVPAIPALLGFLKANWKVVAVVSVVAACYFYVNGLHNDIAEARQDLRDEQALRAEDAKQYALNEQLLKHSINEQNQYVEQLKINFDEAKVRLSQAETEMAETRQKHKKELNALLREQTPTTSDDTIQYLFDKRGDLSWPES
jgi:septal ring factor EnvC (AmiA/AmiB activator)